MTERITYFVGFVMCAAGAVIIGRQTSPWVVVGICLLMLGDEMGRKQP